MAAITQLLTKLHIPIPTQLPRLYNSYHTLAELADRLRQRSPGVTQSGIDWDKDMSGVDERDALELGRYLHDRAPAIGQETTDTTILTQWADLLTPHSSCLSRGRAATQSTTTANSPADSSRCILRLDFATPLMCSLVGAFLHRHDQAAATSTPSTAPNTAPRPAVAWEVSHYQRRLIAARVTGFAIGPLSHDPTGRFTSLAELHGNYHALWQWLRVAAPHCAPATIPLTLYSGVGAVDFVLEETHMAELHALSGRTDPDWGITRPLRLHVSILRQSPNTACSVCGEAQHKARDCPSKPAGGALTCKGCFGSDHSAEHCPVEVSQRMCKLCNQHGHSTLACSRYRARWVDVVLPDRKGGGGGQNGSERPQPLPQPRNTFAAERIAMLQGRPFVPPQAAATAAPPTTSPSARPHTASQQSYSSRVQQTLTTPQTQPTQQSTQRPDSVLEQRMVDLLERMDEDRREMNKRLDQILQLVMQHIGIRGAPDALRTQKETPYNYPGSPWHMSPLHSTMDTPPPTTAAPMQATSPVSSAATTTSPASSDRDQTSSTADTLSTGTRPTHHSPAAGTRAVADQGFSTSHHTQTGFNINHSSINGHISLCGHTPPSPSLPHDAGHHTGHQQQQQQQQHPPAYGVQTAPTQVPSNEQ